MKLRYCALVIVFLSTTAYSQESKKDYTEAFKLVDVWLEAQKDFDQLPGLTASVVQDQEVLWSGAFGFSNVEKRVKAKASTLGSICSISKLFTSVAIMKLYDQGKLRLDDRVSDLLPSYNLQQKFADSGPITIRSLLTHSSGLPREAGYPYWNGPDFPFPSRKQINAKLSEQETLYPASTYFQYSNLGLSLLGEIVAEVSGVSFDKYIQENILKPLALADTRTELPKALLGSELAIGYSAILRNGSREKVNYFRANGLTSAAGFSSNVHDLGRFAAWQFRLRDVEVAEILKPSTIKHMQNVHWMDPDWKNTLGLGFHLSKTSNGNLWAGHSGNCPGYQSTLQLDIKNKRAFSVMINANGTSPRKYVRGINAIINKVKAPQKEDTSTAKTNGLNLQDYVGYYDTQPWWAELYVSTWDGKLVSISLPSEKPAESMVFYKHIQGDVFRRVRRDDQLGETLVFERDTNDQITRFKRHEYYSTKVSVE